MVDPKKVALREILDILPLSALAIATTLTEVFHNVRATVPSFPKDGGELAERGYACGDDAYVLFEAVSRIRSAKLRSR